MKQYIIQNAIALTLLVVPAVHAQDAVQWKVANGGNGHWYIGVYSWLHWADAKVYAESLGGHLATTTSQSELDIIRPLINNRLGADYWLGASRESVETPWNWVTSEPFKFSPWEPGAPDNGPESLCLEVIGRPASPGFGMWNDEVYYSWGGGNYSIIEFEVDCNSDGIVDYGQCHDGTLPDYNGNDIPDCCEQGTTCVPGRYPVQWKVTEGGNGHWYGMRAINQADMTWMQMREAATRLGGHLITLSSAEEDAFGFRYFAGIHEEMMAGPLGYFVMPGGQWEAVTGEPISYSNWRPAMTQPPLAAAPDNGNTLHRFATWLDPSWGPVAGSWEDWQDSELGNPADPISRFLIEWSADCNNDNIVDYGQILQGQLADANTNGIPDICEVPTCHDIDLNLNGIVEGGDLGVLLAFWGTVSPAFPRADINSDGLVNGADLGLLLAFWGPCPN